MRPMARRRGLLFMSLLVLGSVLTAVGVGLGLPHLATDGVGPGDVVGGAALVMGAVLLLAGGVGLVRVTPGWWRLATAPAVLVAAALAVYVLATPLAAAFPARQPVNATPAVDVEEVTVPTSDGELLAGWFAPAPGGAAVVLLPGSGSSRDAVVDHLAVLKRGGYAVLALDPRGHGRSTGRGMDWGWSRETDVAGAVTYLADRADVDAGRIAVVGLSMGGEQAIGAVGADERVRAVVAEGVTGRGAADLHWLPSVYGWRGSVAEALHQATTAVADVLSPADPPPTLRAAAAAAGPRPILLVVAGTAVDEDHAAADIRGASPGNVTVWTVPMARHIGALRTDPEAWAEHVLGFLDEHVG